MKVILLLLIISFIFSCSSDSESRVIYEESFNIYDLEEDPPADSAFINRYIRSLEITSNLYQIEDSTLTNEHMIVSSSENDLERTLNFEFLSISDTTRFSILNTLVEFKDYEDVGTGWALGETIFWASVHSETRNKEKYLIYRSANHYPVGDESEYSEVELIEGTFLVSYHIKWNRLIVHFDQLIEEGKKAELLEQFKRSFEDIKNAFYE
ncbi:MAG: hypothetical protein COA33_013435 [Fluviicola sp.]|nr:hypothetical protein [Fluviicola sp.]